MWNGEWAKALTRDNLGGRKGMRPVEVSMNQCLLYDLIRAKRGRAVIMSNDAWVVMIGLPTLLFCWPFGLWASHVPRS